MDQARETATADVGRGGESVRAGERPADEDDDGALDQGGGRRDVGPRRPSAVDEPALGAVAAGHHAEAEDGESKGARATREAGEWRRQG